MELYYATKHVTPEAFKDYMLVSLDKELYKILNFHIKVYSSPEFLQDDNIEIVADRLLLSEELDAIHTAINSYDDSTNEMAIRYGIEVNTMNQASDFGRDLSNKMASSNIYRGKHVTKITYNGVEKEITSHIVDEHYILIINMLTGSLTDVYRTIVALQPNELFAQDELDEMKKRLELYLGV